MPTTKTRTIKKAIIFVGNGGVGKSYICNKIFAQHSVPARFKSSASLRTVTAALQSGTISRNGVEYTILDTPGFFDNSDPTKSPAQIDGENLCKLVSTMEACEEIYALIYVYTDRFLEPQKLWYDRLRLLLTPAREAQIILLHNKVDPDTDPVDLALNARHLQDLVSVTGSRYFWLAQNFEPTQIENFLRHVTQLCPIQVEDLIIPEVCYEKEELGPQFRKVIPDSTTAKDEGTAVTLTTNGHKVVEETHYGGGRYNVDLKVVNFSFGPRAKTVKQVLVPVTTTEDKHVTKMVTRRKVGIFVQVFKVRWDGTRDLVGEREVDERLREDEVFGE